ncbi:hypothetical protein O6H91_04G146900 [Diphasiastrum complanatum]|uniref:Uncharacterized protein n=1 Tax=Diphasiastrum complanatum TaxID=34168 RepID=A0ACC2E346_DIPCM|nr:hypothetical protein O6H91_04G146900 [Diphasiastrum complanatum]
MEGIQGNAASQRSPFVLLVGGSGYVGLHLLQALACKASFKLAYTYTSHRLVASEVEQKLGLLPGYKVDLQSGDGLVAISASLGSPVVVINCAAMSVPRECEANPSKAMDVNVPSRLVQWLESLECTDPPLLIQFSSDQVYAGSKSFYLEEDETKPVNIYGQSKVAAEKFVKENWPNHVILRSSIIYGPHPLIPVTKSLPVQWIDAELSKGKPVEFFHDEYRCPVFVKDIVYVIETLLSKCLSDFQEKSTCNCCLILEDLIDCHVLRWPKSSLKLGAMIYLILSESQQHR